MAVRGSSAEGEEDGIIEVLDMEEYFSGDTARVAKFCEHLREICHKVGFFYVKNHRVPQDLCDSFLQLGREFFDMPFKEKMRLDYRNSPQFRGYMKIGEELTGGMKDFREQLDLGPEEAEDVDIVDGKEQRLVYPLYRRLRGPNQWPSDHDLPDFKAKAEELMEKMGALSMHIMQAIALSLGLRKDYFDSTFQPSPHYQMRVLRYPPKPQTEDAEKVGMFGVGEHTDSGYLVLLLQDLVGGLQAQTSGGKWTDIPPKKGTLVVNLGEMLQLATGGYYLATLHRVQSQTGSRSRYSLPFFFNPKLEADIRALNMVANTVYISITAQSDDSPLPSSLQEKESSRKRPRKCDEENKMIPIFGQNAFKVFARSHPESLQEHHADLLQFDGKLTDILSTLEKTAPKSSSQYDFESRNGKWQQCNVIR
ncbi:unnamed protein product [Calypogeia fissa]